MTDLGMIPNFQYGLALADPPWKFKLYSDKGQEKSAQIHYECKELEALSRIGRDAGLEWCMAPDCVLVMWATWPMIPVAMELMAEWGFKYKTGGAWAKRTAKDKAAFGTGYIYRSSTEPWILGTRGRPPIRSHSIRNVIYAATRGHSRKPDEMYEMCEVQYDGPYVELFSRSGRDGWTSWGDEVGKF